MSCQFCVIVQNVSFSYHFLQFLVFLLLFHGFLLFLCSVFAHISLTLLFHTHCQCFALFSMYFYLLLLRIHGTESSCSRGRCNTDACHCSLCHFFYFFLSLLCIYLFSRIFSFLSFICSFLWSSLLYRYSSNIYILILVYHFIFAIHSLLLCSSDFKLLSYPSLVVKEALLLSIVYQYWYSVHYRYTFIPIIYIVLTWFRFNRSSIVYVYQCNCVLSYTTYLYFRRDTISS